MSDFHTIPFFIGHYDPARHGTVEEELLHHAEDVGVRLIEILKVRAGSD